MIKRILKAAVRGGATDIILKVGCVPKFRFNGELVALSDGEVITEQIMKQWAKELVPDRLAAKLKTIEDLDFSFQISDSSRFRVNLFRQRRHLGMVLRCISSHIRTIEELQLPKILKNLAEHKNGLVLVTGATGSGKSTTMAALIEHINRNQSSHIVTVEDPIEFEFKDQSSTIQQREIGTDTESFTSALRSALRQNPDVIFVGELRDKETVETALTAAETGHLVLSTMHTSDAIESLTRVMSFFSPHQQTSIRMMLASTMKAIVSQRLIPRLNKQGMVPAFEIMVVNASIRDYIERGDSFHDISELISKGHDTYGMQTFDQSLLQLYMNRAITKEQAMLQSTSKDDLLLQMNGIS